MPTVDNLKEMSWTDRRAYEQRHFAACKDAATENIMTRAREDFAAEQRRVEEKVATTSFSSRQALQVYVTYERKGRLPNGLTTRDHDELRAIVAAIWPAYAAARGIPEDRIISTTAEQQAAHRMAQS